MGAALLAALAVVGVSAAAVVIRRRGAESRATGVEAYVRPILYTALEQGDIDPQVFDALSRSQKRALEAQARSLLPKVRGSDREALGRLLDRWGAVETARHDRHSRRAGTRARAGLFLGDSGCPEAVRDLIELLNDRDPQVRWAAVRGLGRLGHPSAVSPLLRSIEGARAIPVDLVADAIIQIRECPISVLRQGVRSRSVPTRAATVELLGRFQALALASIDDVIGVLHDDASVEVRARAARALGRMGSPRAVDDLLASVGDGPLAMRVQAVWALGEIGSAEAIPALRALLLGPTRQLTEPSAAALAAMGQVGMPTLREVADGSGHPAAVAAQALAARADLEPSRF